ncbi:MAG TPA: hypothetical protein VK469_09465, partial [Candidatus Kapabacteria bacterium]|nr:hypothetical protein [Candidatus Kapabacteria bacterium]
KKFVINVAKIELWLHGFDGVEIDGQESYIMPPRTERSRMPLANRKAQYPFYNALCEYWDIWKDRRALDHECMKKIATSKDVEKYKSLDDALSRADYSTLTENITPVFFASLHCVYEDDSDSDFDYCGELAKKIENKEISVDVQWEIIKKKGSRLWDGIKRVWKWIKKQFKKIFVFFKNIFARTIFRYAAKAFKIVKRAVSAIVETVEYLVHNKMDGSDLENIFVLHDSDFDQKVFISQNADPEKVNEFVRRWNVIIARFNLGSKIIGIVFFCIKNVNTIVGWARIVYSFIKDMKTLKPIYEQLKVVEAVA